MIVFFCPIRPTPNWQNRSRSRGSAGATRGYDERWLQTLIHRHPELLPVGDIEPAFLPLLPVGMELPTPNGGYIDNFLITPTGNLVFIECKS